MVRRSRRSKQPGEPSPARRRGASAWWIAGATFVGIGAVALGFLLLLRGPGSAAERGTQPAAAVTAAATVTAPESPAPAVAEEPQPDPDDEEPAEAASATPATKAVAKAGARGEPIIVRVADPSGLPEALGRADVLAGLGPIKALVARCWDQVAGDGTVKFTIASSGRVVSATVNGTLAGTPTAECIADAARSAVFRSTRRDQTTVTMPFVLRAPDPEEP
jgi:hypothetical protein